MPTGSILPLEQPQVLQLTQLVTYPLPLGLEHGLIQQLVVLGLAGVPGVPSCEIMQLRVGIGVQHLAWCLAVALVHRVEGHAPQDEIQLDRAGAALGEQRGEVVADVGLADPELVLAHELGQVGQALWLLGHWQPLENCDQAARVHLVIALQQPRLPTF